MSVRTGKLRLALIGWVLLSSPSSFANDDAEYTCEEAAGQVSSIIDDWYQLVRDAGAETKNPSVVAMHADEGAGVLVEKFKQRCVASWAAHEAIYACFSGVRSELGAAMCLHPDTNPNDWRYR